MNCCGIGCDYGMVFVFKQKTAYYMRISDWSSDWCSSDLQVHAGLRLVQHLAPARRRRLGAEAKVAEPGLGEDGERELDGHLHDEQARDVGQDVLEGDARAALAGDPGGQHEVALPQIGRAHV